MTIPGRSGPGSAFPVGSGRTTVQESTSTRSVPKKLGEGSDELDRSVLVKLVTGVQHVEFAIGNTPCHGRQFVAWQAAVGADQYQCWSGDRSQVAPPRRVGIISLSGKGRLEVPVVVQFRFRPRSFFARRGRGHRWWRFYEYKAANPIVVILGQQVGGPWLPWND